jgi:hypothetical protein
VWRFWTRLVRPAQLFAATNARLAIIREEEELKTPRYGYSAWTIPRRSSAQLAVTEHEGSVALTLRSLPGALRFEALPEHRTALEGLVALSSGEPDAAAKHGPRTPEQAGN